MSKKVFIGNVPFQAQDEDLRGWFTENSIFPAGVAIVKHRVTGKSRGFGFADFQRSEEAEAAVNALNGAELLGRRLMLSLAHSDGPAVQAAETAAVAQG
ncbi:MAG TPA: RNA-binding protein [Bryobacteraceae bacterium]|nr:RNA-binding protein [Bryobacteraceae bacterium]